MARACFSQCFIFLQFFTGTLARVRVLRGTGVSVFVCLWCLESSASSPGLYLLPRRIVVLGAVLPVLGFVVYVFRVLSS